jgi:Tfp pilus assembly protein PilO
MLSSKSSRWIAGTCVACLVVATASWFLLIGPRRSHAAQLRDQSQSVHSANDTLRLQIAQLKAQFAALPGKRAELAKVQRQLPPTAAMPALVRSLNGIADTTGVSLDSITPGAAVLASAAGGAASAGAPAGATGAAAPSGSTVIIPVSVAVTGDYFAATLFMKQLQTQLRRALLVTGISVGQNSTASGSDSSGSSGSSANAASGDIQLTITGQVFVLPTTPAAGSSPSSGTAATGTTTTTSSGTTPGTTTGTSGATVR